MFNEASKCSPNGICCHWYTTLLSSDVRGAVRTPDGWHMALHVNDLGFAELYQVMDLQARGRCHNVVENMVVRHVSQKTQVS